MKDFLQLCHDRFSARKFTAEPISKADLRYIQEAVRLAPSATNAQPWKFLLISSTAAREQLQACYDRPWFITAPLYIVCMKNEEKAWMRPADGKKHGDIDLAIAIEHLCLAAADRGLGTCWVCNFNPDMLRQYFPFEGFEAVAIIPVGHLADDCPRPEKRRKCLEEIFEER